MSNISQFEEHGSAKRGRSPALERSSTSLGATPKRLAREPDHGPATSSIAEGDMLPREVAASRAWAHFEAHAA